MTWRISYHPETEDDISDLPKNIKTRIQKAVEQRLLVDPARYGVALRRNLQGYRKLRVGDYRVIFKLDKNTIVVLKIGHRKEVYQKIQLRG